MSVLRTQRFATVRRSLVIMLGIIVALHLITQISRNVFNFSDFWIDLSSRFNVDEEASFPTWYSASLLLGLSGAAYWLSTKLKGTKHTVWKWIAIIFLLMSIDEGSSLHETIIWPLRRALDIEQGSLLTNAWVIVGAVIIAGLGFGLLQIAKYLEPTTRRYFLFGFILYAGGILGIETLGGLFVENEALYRTIVVLIEETFELVGMTYFAFGLLHEIETQL